MAEGTDGGRKRDSGRHEIKSIGGYELLALLGRGGMGAVYKARQVSMDRIVALKILPPSLARDASFVGRFEREAHAAGRLSHPNIVTGIDVGEADGYHYFAMEYVEGESLNAVIAREGRLAEKPALALAAQVARALAHAHAHGLVHRDVKPQNILIAAGGVAKLCDLGLARSTQEDQSLTLSGTAVGTPHYIAPEQVEGRKDVDGRVDLYALGATLYHMLSGKPPFEAPTAAKVMAMHLHEPVPPLAQRAPDVSPAAAAVVARLLEKDREKRYGSAADLADDLENISAGRPPAHLGAPKARVGTAVRARPVSGRQAPVGAAAGARPLWRRPLVLAGAGGGAGILILAALTAVLISRENRPPPPPPPVKPPVAVAPPPVKPPPAEDAAEKELKELYDYAEKWAKDNPEAFEESAKRFRRVVEHADRLQKPLVSLRADDEAKRFDKLREDALAAAFAGVETKARERSKERDFDGALAACAELPARWEKALRPRSERLAADLREEADQLFQPALAAGRAALESGKPQDGLAALAELEGVKYAPRTKEAAELAETLRKAGRSAEAAREAQRLAEAQKALAKLLDDFDAAVKASPDGEYLEARRLAREAAGKEAPAPVAAVLQALGEVAEALPAPAKAEAAARAKLVGQKVTFQIGREPETGVVTALTKDGFKAEVTFRIPGVPEPAKATRDVPFSALSPADAARLREGFVPKTAAEHLAVAAAALARGDAARAEAGLAAAGEHPLAARYRDALEAGRLGAAEFAAQKAWAELLKSVPEKLDKPIGERLLGLVAKFEAEHLKSKFGAGRVGDLAALRARAQDAVGGFTIQKLFKGRVESFDPATLNISLVYDFSSPEQLQDWRSGCESYTDLEIKGDWPGTPVENARVEGGKVRPTQGRLSLWHAAPFSGDIEFSLAAPLEPAFGSYGGGPGLLYHQPADSARPCTIRFCTRQDKDKSLYALLSHGMSYNTVQERKPLAPKPGFVRQALRLQGTAMSFLIDGQPVIADWTPPPAGAQKNVVLQKERPLIKLFLIGFSELGETRIKGVVQKEWLEDRMRRLKAASEPPPDLSKLDLAAVQKLFKGRVESFDPATLNVSLVYDFSDPGQKGDWVVPAKLLIHHNAENPYGHAAIFTGDLEFSFTEALTDATFSWTHTKGGLVWQGAGASDWNAATGGFDHSIDQKNTFVQMWIGIPRGPDRAVKNDAPYQKKAGGTCAQVFRVSRDQPLTYSIDGQEVLRDKQPLGAAALRPVLPAGEIKSARVKGTLQRAWLEERAGRPAAGAENAPPGSATLAAVQKLFKGKVESFDPATGRITLAYNFKGANFAKAEGSEDWAVNAARSPGTQALYAHKAVFTGDLEFACTVFTAAWWRMEKSHGGVAWQREDAQWQTLKAGIVSGEDPKTTFAQIYWVGLDRYRKESSLKPGERPCATVIKLTGGQQVAFSVDGAEAAAQTRPFRPAALRPFLPGGVDAVMAAKIVGTLQKAWLDEQFRR